MTFLRGVLVFVGVMFLQWWWNTHLSYWGITPQFLFTLGILVASRRGPVAAMLIAWTWGLYADALRADLFGANALLYTLAAYIAGNVRRQMDLRAVGPLATAVFILSVVYALAMGLIGTIFAKSFFWIGWPAFLVAPFLNAFVAACGALAWEIWGNG